MGGVDALPCVYSSKLNIERFQGRFLKVRQIKFGQFYSSPLYIGDILHSRDLLIRLAYTRFLRRCFLLYRSFVRRAADRGRAVPLSLRRRSEDLHGCRRIRFLKSELAQPLVIFFTDGSISSFSQDPL
jgi:hypothetical protein